MKKILLFIFFGLLFISCNEDVDNSDQICTGFCNSVYGRIKRADGTGIPLVKVYFSAYKQSGLGGGSNRFISKAYSNADGNYGMLAFLQDNEIASGQSFYAVVDVATIQALLTDEFIKPLDFVRTYPDQFEGGIPPVSSRDERIDVPDFVVPFKSTITIRLNNFNNSAQTNLFEVTNVIEYGFANKNLFLDRIQATNMSEEFELKARVGKNDVRIQRNKNGQYSEEIMVVDIPSNPSNVILDFEY